MDNGELHIKIESPKYWPIEIGNTKAAMVCGNCFESVGDAKSPGAIGIAMFVPLSCPKCGARFSKIVGNIE